MLRKLVVGSVNGIPSFRPEDLVEARSREKGDQLIKESLLEHVNQLRQQK
jgi:hypothetical protein